jgi:hypothetical protein
VRRDIGSARHERYYSLLGRKVIIMVKFIAGLLTIGALSFGALVPQASIAQTRKNVFVPGEQLVYKVKYGFIKLGTVTIQTGNFSADGSTVAAHMTMQTADVPMLNVKTAVTDRFDTKDLTLRSFEEHTQNGDSKSDKYMTYDAAAKTIHYQDEKTPLKTETSEPYDDALGILYNLRAWSGAAGKKYMFHVHGKDGARPITLSFTNDMENQQVPAYGDNDVKTRVVKGMADMAGSGPLGANGAFTAYVTDDAAAIPVRLDMDIAIGSISLVLDKVKRPDVGTASMGK